MLLLLPDPYICYIFYILIKFIEQLEESEITNRGSLEKYRELFIYNDIKMQTIDDVKHIMRGFYNLYKNDTETGDIDNAKGQIKTVKTNNSSEKIVNKYFLKDIQKLERYFNFYLSKNQADIIIGGE